MTNGLKLSITTRWIFPRAKWLKIVRGVSNMAFRPLYFSLRMRENSKNKDYSLVLAVRQKKLQVVLKT
jgi:hypothetical protein